jgi:TPR repeat protein
MNGKASTTESSGMIGSGRRGRPSFFGHLLQLFRSDPTFRALAEFTAIGGVVLFSLTYWPTQESSRPPGPKREHDAEKIAGDVPEHARTKPAPAVVPAGVSIQFPGEVTNPTLKNFVVFDIDETAFASSSEADRPRLALAARYFRGEQFSQMTEALKTADPKDRNVAFMLGLALADSQGATANDSIPLLRAASDAGQRQASLMLGRQLVISTDPEVKNVEQGRRLIEAAAGDRDAQRLAGIAYMSGEFGFIDVAKARESLRLAAQAGDVPAMFSYAFMLGWGIRGPADQAAAADLLRRAAAAGLTSAQETLGDWLISQYDHKLIDDPGEGLEWLDKAVRLGHSVGAVRSLARFYGDPRRPAPWHRATTAYALARMCSGMRDAWCQAENGWIYEKGVGTGVDLVRAVAHHQVALQLGDTEFSAALQALMARLGDADKIAAIKYTQMITAALVPPPTRWRMQYVGAPTAPSPWVAAPEPPAAGAAPDAVKPIVTNPRPVQPPTTAHLSPRRISVAAPQFSGDLTRLANGDWRMDYSEKGKPGRLSANLKMASENDKTIELFSDVNKVAFKVDIGARQIDVLQGDKLKFYANVVGMQIATGLSDIQWSLRAPEGASADVVALFGEYLNKENIKAFAVSKDKQSAGSGWTKASVEEARAAALKYCGAECKIFAVNNFIVDHKTALRLPDGMSQEMNDNFAQYLAANDEKAFAIRSDGRFAWVSGGASLAEAKARALKDCGENCNLFAIGDEPVK